MLVTPLAYRETFDGIDGEAQPLLGTFALRF